MDLEVVLEANTEAALIIDCDRRVRTQVRLVNISEEEWKSLLRGYLWADRCACEAGVPVSKLLGGYLDESEEMRFVFEEKIKPYEVFSDEQYGLTVRAAFCPESAVGRLDGSSPRIN
jgi:hypothetical protein